MLSSDLTPIFRKYCLDIDPTIIFNHKKYFQPSISPVSQQHCEVLSIIKEYSKQVQSCAKLEPPKLRQRKSAAIKAAVFDSSDSEVEIENDQFKGLIKLENDLMLKELEQNYDMIASATAKLMEINEMQSILANNLDQQNEQIEDIYGNSSQTVEMVAKGLEELRRNERENKPKFWVLYLFIAMSVALLFLDYLSSY